VCTPGLDLLCACTHICRRSTVCVYTHLIDLLCVYTSVRSTAAFSQLYFWVGMLRGRVLRRKFEKFHDWGKPSPRYSPVIPRNGARSTMHTKFSTEFSAFLARRRLFLARRRLFLARRRLFLARRRLLSARRRLFLARRRLVLARRRLSSGTAVASFWHGGGYFWHGGG
jgi:hypothetical protein